MRDKFLFIDNHNFKDYPVGGKLTFARHLLRLYKNRIALVGIAGEKEPVGRWFKKVIDGVEYDYFAFRREGADFKKGLLPKRLRDFVGLILHRRRIREYGCREVLTQSQVGAIALSFWRWDIFCVCMTGVSNIAEYSKFFWVKPFAKLYSRLLYNRLKETTHILATADDEAIREWIAKSRGALSDANIIKFPTRIDLKRIPDIPKNQAREMLSLPKNKKIVLYCARISWPKGWDLVLGGFAKAAESEPALILLVVGDGEDVPNLKEKARSLGVANRIVYVDRQPPERVITYYQASDVYAIGSHVEGWSNSMLEALATGTPMVSTAVSGAKDMIRNGENGFVVSTRNPCEFSVALIKTFQLQQVRKVSENIVQSYRVETIFEEFKNAGLWI